MDPHCITLSPNQRALLLCLIAIWLSYYVIMDAILYSTLQSVPDFIHEKKVPGTMWSPFRPLSVKLIMQDPTTHYVLTPLSEYFNEITRFSDVFYFITPNMITFTHLTLSFVSAKFIVSDSLKSRRIGVLIYELRSWLDAFDGTVFRARAANKKYTSHHSELGFWIDSTSDTIGGFALSFAVLFYFYWKCPPKKELSPLPWTIEEKNGKNGNRNECNGEKHDVKSYKYYTKKFIFWVCFCFGAQVGLASAMWDQTNWKLTDIFNTELSTPELASLQTDYLHSTGTFIVFWGWRLLEGQALQHYFLLAIFIDRAWEFLRFVQYLGFVFIGSLSLFSFYHISQIRSGLHIASEASS